MKICKKENFKEKIYDLIKSSENDIVIKCQRLICITNELAPFAFPKLFFCNKNLSQDENILKRLLDILNGIRETTYKLGYDLLDLKI